MLVVELFKSRHNALLLIKNTLLSNYFRLGAFQGNLHFEAAFNLTFFVFLLCNVAVIKNFREVLLSCTSYPNLVITGFGELGDDFLQVQVAVTLLVDELANFIGQHNQAVVIAFILQIGSQL